MVVVQVLEEHLAQEGQHEGVHGVDGEDGDGQHEGVHGVDRGDGDGSKDEMKAYAAENGGGPSELLAGESQRGQPEPRVGRDHSVLMPGRDWQQQLVQQTFSQFCEERTSSLGGGGDAILEDTEGDSTFSTASTM